VAKEKTGARGMSGEYEVVIGLEVHAQLRTRTKMFCGCSTAFGAPPNSQTCPVCQGMPGTLPVINRRAVEFGIKTALAIGCSVSADNRFARKHYYYPDMPKNYQISQYEEPLAVHGHLDIEVGGDARRIGIERLHLEEDVGKLIHEGSLETAQSSQVDFNRAGVPLMEIVSKPDMRTSEEAGAYLRALRAIVVYLDVCDGNMEEGSMRCDANISLKKRGAAEFGTKVEVKNMNSFRNVQHALEYEIKRQGRALEAGERIVQETRLWDPDKGQTVSMRSKEFAHDYRYFPEPDLPPLNVEARWVEAVRATLPELPAAKRQRFKEVYALNAHDAVVVTSSQGVANYFEEAAKESSNKKTIANWVVNEVLRFVPLDDEKAIKSFPIQPANLAGLVTLIENGTISGKIAKDVFEKMYRSGEDARTIVSREGLTQVADADVVGKKVDEVLSTHAKVVEDYKAGKKAALGFLIGQVMKSTEGKANPALVNQLLVEKLPKV
jgi:aspartyl-tRNA(Asn)/glutamyl-tRNA(Gln) amidotransferase subunit B